MPLVLTNRRRRGGSASAPAFSPSTLYSSGSQGIWLDPSDLTTMFSDRAGTTPVTTPGTTVGLRLDKSKGLVLGPELVVNGTFDSGTTGWASSSGFASTATVVSGEFQVTTTGSFGRQIQAITCVVGKTYKVSCTARVVSGGVSALIERTSSTGTGVGPFSSTTSTATTTLSMVFTATSTTEYICVGAGSGGTGHVMAFDNVSVKQLPGNHAVAPTDAARPIYGVEPKGGRRNLLTWSEDFGNAAWAMTSATVATNTITAPDGTLTADTITRTTTGGLFAQTTTGLNTANLQLTLSFYVYPPAGVTSLTVRIDRVGIGQGNQTVKTVVPETWTRVTHSVTLDANTQSPVPRIDLTGGASLSIWGAQLELGSTATAYQRVLSAYDITESGVATCHYVQYDGSDDSLSTSSIDFTGTDKMSVFAGVRKLSDAAVSVILELSTNINSNNGSFILAAGTSTVAGPNYHASSKGTSIATANSTSSFAAPISNVITDGFDILGDINVLRLNGTQNATSTSDQGTGNFGNHPIFIGRRNNATSPFNGRDYGILVVGKAASAGEISDTETWLAAKTSGVTL